MLKSMWRKGNAPSLLLGMKACAALWKTVWRCLIKLKIELSYDPSITLLGIYPNKSIIQKDAFTCIFKAALFTIVKTWRQPKYPLTDEWIKRMWYIYTMQYYSTIRKEQNNAICSNMDGPRDYHNKSERERQVLYDVTYVRNLK